MPNVISKIALRFIAPPGVSARPITVRPGVSISVPSWVTSSDEFENCVIGGYVKIAPKSAPKPKAAPKAAAKVLQPLVSPERAPLPTSETGTDTTPAVS